MTDERPQLVGGSKPNKGDGRATCSWVGGDGLGLGGDGLGLGGDGLGLGGDGLGLGRDG